MPARDPPRGQPGSSRLLRRMEVPLGRRRRSGSAVRCQVEPSGIDQEPMHGDVGIAKLGELASQVRRAVSRHGHDDVGGPGPVDEAARVDRCPPGPGRDRSGDGGPDDGIGTAGSRRSDDRRRRSRRSTARSRASCRDCERAFAHRAGRRPARPGFARVSPDAATRSSRSFMNRCRSLGDDMASGAGVRGGPNCLGRGTYHPGQTSLETDSFKLFDRPIRR